MSQKAKPITPYARLLAAFRQYASAVKYPHTQFMWRYPKKRLHEGWQLTDLAERVAAADQLGFEVVLQNDEEGLKVLYRKKRPETPWEIR